MKKKWVDKGKIEVFIKCEPKTFTSIVDENFSHGGGVCLVYNEENVSLILKAPRLLVALEDLVNYQKTGEDKQAMKRAIELLEEI